MEPRLLAWLTWTYIAAEIVVRLWLAVIVIRRKSPSVAVAWLLIIFLNAWVGLVLYLFFGDVRLGSIRLRRRESVRGRIARHFTDADDACPDGTEHVADSQHDIVRLSRALGGMPAVAGNATDVFDKPEPFIDRLVADIDAAEVHAHLLFYIFVHDETGVRVADALKRAAARGVACRLVADSVGSRRFLKKPARDLRRAGVEVVEALPVGLFRHLFSRIDLRNHRKIVVIDGRIGYTGSQNIVNADYGGKGGVGAWRDLMARVEGPVVRQLQRVFVEDWACERSEELHDDECFPDIEPRGPTVIQTVPSGPSFERESFRDLVVALVAESEERVIITSPYLIPDEQFILSLRIAVLRGVDVHVIVPKKPDQRLVGAAGRAYVRELLEAGVHVHLHENGLLHAKTMSVDSAVGLLGTANFDIRSFAINFEVSMIGYGADVADRLAARQQRYMEESTEMTLDVWRRRHAVRVFFDDVARLFSPLL